MFMMMMMMMMMMIDFTHIAASNTASDDVTKIRSHKILKETYNVLMLVI